MSQPQPAPPPPAPTEPSALQTLGHYLRAGILGGIFGMVFALVVFYLLLVGLLYAGQSIHGKDQESVVVPGVPNVALAPPINAVDLEPLPGKQDAAVDTDYLRTCSGQVWDAVDLHNNWRTPATWMGVAVVHCLAVSLLGVILLLLFGQYWSPMLGLAALLTALAGIGVFVSHVQFQVPMPIELNSEGRLLIYVVVATVNLLWISVAGFRFRAILFALATVIVGEVFQLGLPPENWTTTALWFGCVFLFVPTGYAWLVVERAERKGILFKNP